MGAAERGSRVIVIEKFYASTKQTPAELSELRAALAGVAPFRWRSIPDRGWFKTERHW